MIAFEQLESKIDPNIKVCKGLYWRAKINTFLSSYNSIEHKESLRFLKRKSCPGCEQCGWVFDYIQEAVGFDGIVIQDLEDGGLYTYNVVTSKGYYDPYPETDYIEFIKVKKENEPKT